MSTILFLKAKIHSHWMESVCLSKFQTLARDFQMNSGLDFD